MMGKWIARHMNVIKSAEGLSTSTVATSSWYVCTNAIPDCREEEIILITDVDITDLAAWELAKAS
jgi:hypothetical protein